MTAVQKLTVVDVQPFKIEKGVPVPSTAGRGARAIYPFAQMDVGDSFLIPASSEGFYTNKKGGRGHRVQNASGHWRTKGIYFTTRTLPDGSMRVWRVK